MTYFRFSRKSAAAAAVSDTAPAAPLPVMPEVGPDPVPGAASPVASRLLLDAIPQRQRAVATIVPVEDTGLMSVALPLRSDRQKRAALPFAVEETLADPLEDTHVALARDLPEGRVLAVVIARDRIRQLCRAHPGQALLPEIFVLAPPEGDAPAWATLRDGDRVLVRASDGSGFVCAADMLAYLWTAAGRPGIVNHGAPLPDGLPWTDAPTPAPLPAELAVDLRQGEFRPRRDLRAPLGTLTAGIALIGLLHLGIAWADVRALRGLVDTQREQTAALLAERIPEATVHDDPQMVYRRLVRASSRTGGSALLPRLDAASGALLASGVPVNVRRLVWSAEGDTLTMQIEAPGLSQLQSAEDALRNGGLAVDVGTATADDGAARAEFALRAGGGQ